MEIVSESDEDVPQHSQTLQSPAAGAHRCATALRAAGRSKPLFRVRKRDGERVDQIVADSCSVPEWGTAYGAAAMVQ